MTRKLRRKCPHQPGHPGLTRRSRPTAVRGHDDRALATGLGVVRPHPVDVDKPRPQLSRRQRWRLAQAR